jgi:hypothetical protein
MSDVGRLANSGERRAYLALERAVRGEHWASSGRTVRSV